MHRCVLVKKKILKLVPSPSAKGGISNYYQVLQGNYNVEVEYFIRGARDWPNRKGSIYEIVRAYFDLIHFCLKLMTQKYYVVQTTTSLGFLALIRDGLFVIVAKLFRVKVVVFFRGLDEKIQKNIEKKWLTLFKKVFFLSDSMIVLSSQFKEKLEYWGYNRPIYLETTVVDEQLVRDIATENIIHKFETIGNRINILFLARVEKTKGIYEAIDSYNILKQKYPEVSFTLAGDGFELNHVKDYVAENCIKNIVFTGFVTGKAKKNIFKKSHIYLFPSYTEGMPTSVLEAMAFGLPVVTTNVGGLADFFINGEHGFITESKDPVVLAGLIDVLIKDKKALKKIALHNHKYAIENFTTSKVIERLEEIFRTLL